MFPENPLSQAHEFLIAVLKDELVAVRHDDEEENGTSADNHTTDPGTELTAEERAEKEKELLLGLFVDECRRHTIQYCDGVPGHISENKERRFPCFES